jgi:hypothetical protein
MDTAADTATTLDPSFVPRFRDEVAFVPVKDEALLYVEATGELHQLDAIGAITCQVFDGTTSIEAAADQLADAFGAPRQQVEADVLAFAERLGGYGLLEGIVADDPATDDDGPSDTEVEDAAT